MSASLGRLIPDLQPWAHRLVTVAATAHVRPTVTSTYRTRAQQQKLYDAFQRGESKYPVAPPGTSAHEFGYAFDLDVGLDGGTLSDLGTVWESWGGVWGGHYGDPVHFEFPGFKTSAAASGSRCGSIFSAVASAVDFVLGFAPYIGEVELLATLASFGFPRSTVLKYLKNPVSKTLCG